MYNDGGEAVRRCARCVASKTTSLTTSASRLKPASSSASSRSALAEEREPLASWALARRAVGSIWNSEALGTMSATRNATSHANETRALSPAMGPGSDLSQSKWMADLTRESGRRGTSQLCWNGGGGNQVLSSKSISGSGCEEAVLRPRHKATIYLASRQWPVVPQCRSSGSMWSALARQRQQSGHSSVARSRAEVQLLFVFSLSLSLSEKM